MKRLFYSFFALSSLVALSLVTSCADDGTDDLVSFDSFTITPTSIDKLYVGETKQIVVEKNPSVSLEGNVKFSVSPISPDKTCAVVDEAGVVTGVSAGNAKIAVSSMDGVWTKLVDVAVFERVFAVSSISINGTFTANADGEKQMVVYTDNTEAAAGLLSATITPEDATSTDVKWSLVDPDKTGSAITAAGDFTPGSKVGEVTITATLFDEATFYDELNTEEDLNNEEITAKYTYIDILNVLITNGSLILDEEQVTKSITDAPFNVTYELDTQDDAAIVEWESSDVKVATVAADGTITIVGAGETTITAKCGSAVDTLTLTVNYLDLTSITIAPIEDTTVDVGESVTLTATPNENANPSVVWSIEGDDTTNSTIVAATGVFTAGDTAGDVTIRATSTIDNTKYDEVTLSVNVPVESISVPSSMSVEVGKSVDIVVAFTPNAPSNTNLNWKSGDTSVATVENGKVTIVGKVGDSTIITATSEDNADAVATCEITVVGSLIPVTSVAFGETSYDITLGGSEIVDLSTKVSVTEGATDRSLIWHSGDENIATVDPSTGVVTAVAEGDVTITATSVSNPSVSGSCTINVVPTRVTSITVSPISVIVGKSAAIAATVAPSNASYQGYTLEVTSGAECVVLDTESGAVIGNAVGTAVVKIISDDASYTENVTCTITVTSGAGIGNLGEGDGSFVIE